MKPCFLYTLDGTKSANCSDPFKDFAMRDVVEISSDDQAIRIHVAVGVANSKFASEEKPTFYTC